METPSDERVRRSLTRQSRSNRSNQWDALLKLTGGMCFYCGCELTLANRSRDHLHPRNLGGKGRRWNLVPACKPCNVAKSDTPINVYRRKVVGNKWFYGERYEIERMVDTGAIDRELALAMLDEGPLGGSK